MTADTVEDRSLLAESRSRTRNGAEILLDTLVAYGIDTIFGYPGGAALPLYDALHGQPAIRHVLVRHEQAAVHAAEGYARTTGRLGVVLVTSGPGMANTVSGLLDAIRRRIEKRRDQHLFPRAEIVELGGVIHRVHALAFVEAPDGEHPALLDAEAREVAPAGVEPVVRS